MAKTISKVRKRKMQAQGGRCYYCGQRMWAESPEMFCKANGVPPRKAKLFECTAEHLVPRSEGGRNHARNIVAACLYCNQTRHTFKEPLHHLAYKAHVQRRLEAGRWLRLSVHG